MSKQTFIDGNPSLGILGSIVTAAFLNALNNHRHTGRDIDGDGALDYAVSTGSANAYVLTLSPALDAFINGMPIIFKANFTNTGAATININGLGAKTMKKNFNQDLVADDIQSGQIVMAIYDGTNFQVLLVKNNFFYAADTGAANAYAAAYTPALTAHVIGLPLRFLSAHVNTGASTFAVNALAVVAIKRLDGTALQAGDIPSGGMITVVYDGTNYQLESVLPSASTGAYSSVRQTVLGGPVDTSGLPSFFPASASGLNLASQNITSSAPFVVSAANGNNASGEVNNIGISTANLTWASLTNSATLFLYVTIANGVLTTGFTALAPIYQWGGTPSNTNGQATYNIQAGTMYLGNGSAAVQTKLVFVGEAVTSGGNITSTVMYAYNGRYNSGYTNTIPSSGTTVSKNHNIGTRLITTGFRLKCLTAEQDWSVGDIVTSQTAINVGQIATIPAITSHKTMVMGMGTTIWELKAGANGWTLTLANWAYEMTARREF